jgi:hypothetical protein
MQKVHFYGFILWMLPSSLILMVRTPPYGGLLNYESRHNHEVHLMHPL